MDKVRRKIIQIDEETCNGCGNCIPACPEQAIEIVDGKARLVKEFYCDGLGACLGSCPTGALTIEEREVEPYDEEASIARIKEVAPELLAAHLGHLKEHAHELPEHHSHEMPGGVRACPSAQMLQWEEGERPPTPEARSPMASELRQWPIQLHLVPPYAPYFQNADLVLVADCVPFAYPNFHADFLKEKAIAIACPKLDDVAPYMDKVTQILRNAHIRTLTVVHMEVPCCYGLVHMAQEALKQSGKEIPFETVMIGIKGERKTQDGERSIKRVS